MLSQTAWRIGRAFTQGRKSAPAEFAEVEREADGLSEALNVEGEEFGDSRIMDTLKTIATLSADQIRDVVARRVKEWCAGMSLYDDLTFVVMKVK